MDDETFGIRNMIVQEIKHNKENPKPLWIAAFNGKLKMVEILLAEPFCLSLDEESCGVTPRILADLKLNSGLYESIMKYEDCTNNQNSEIRVGIII